MPRDAHEMQAQIIAAITTPAGEPVPIDRIEFDVVGRAYRWSLWSAGRRLITCQGRPVDLAGYLAATRELLDPGPDVN